MDDAPSVDVEVLVTAWFTAPLGYALRPERSGRFTGFQRLGATMRPGAPKITCPCMAFVVRHPSRGTLLIDTGFHAQARESALREYGLPMGLVFQALKPVPEPYDVQLRAAGVNPDSVGRVVMTHLHADHTSGLRLLPKAELMCDRREWEAAQSRAGRLIKGYVPNHLPDPARAQLLDFEQDGVPYGGFEQTIDLLRDGSIRLVSTPGHTRGHLSVLLRLEGGRQALLVGDAVYLTRSVREGRLPLMTEDEAAFRRSLAQIQRFAAEDPDALLVPSHDPDAWRALAPASA